MTQRHFVQSDALMFVTTCTHKKQPFFANPVCAREAVECLYRIQAFNPFFLFGFVIMPDHCHFLLNVPAPNTIARIMNVYKAGLSFDTGLGKMWQRRYFLDLPKNGSKVLQYIHTNPVKAGLADTSENYPWSSASGRWEVSDLSTMWS